MLQTDSKYNESSWNITVATENRWAHIHTTSWTRGGNGRITQYEWDTDYIKNMEDARGSNAHYWFHSNSCKEKMHGPSGEPIYFGQEPSDMIPFKFFYIWTFPQAHLLSIVSTTNIILNGRLLPPTWTGEILRFFLILVTLTRLEFSHRRSLWRSQSSSAYLKSPDLRNVLRKHRFETMVDILTWSGQPLHSAEDG